ncbi:rhamnulokinase [Microbacterium sp. 2MCAF23]|uniref:rhamnulokinase n=1 Tax=Microbacterium sp. 2MCAF23 TaxID=3232985 RepID=UPI003F983044
MTDQGRVAAVDLGASSGRVVVADVGPGMLRASTVARFPNEPRRSADGIQWDVRALFDRVLDALRPLSRNESLSAIAIDSWGVDYGLFHGPALTADPYHYRDERNVEALARLRRCIADADLFARTGVSPSRINTAVQLADDRFRGRLAHADRLQMIPDLMGHWLTGETFTEQTIVSTTSLNDPVTGGWDRDLLEELEYPVAMFPEAVPPGTEIGGFDQRHGLQGAPRLIAVGSHDTASAVAALPVRGDEFAFISCGTWAVVGVEADGALRTNSARAAGLTNERGVDGRTRIQRNAPGMWLLNECMRHWARDATPVGLSALLEAASHIATESPVFDVTDPCFTAPGEMPERISRWLTKRGLPAPSSRAALVRCIIESLAECFVSAIEDISRLSGRRVSDIHIVGGGSRIGLLCQRLADLAGVVVLAGPGEATALGNVLVQARRVGLLGGSLEALRDLVATTHPPIVYRPRAGSSTPGNRSVM